MSFQEKFATWAGDVWMPVSRKGKSLTALWPKPAIISGIPRFKIDTDDYRCFAAMLMPGDMIVLAGEAWKLANKGIAKTAFKHLAVYTGAVAGYRSYEFIMKPKSLGIEHIHTGEVENGMWERTVTHAISEGVLTQDLLEVLLHMYDYAAIVRPWKTVKQQEKIVEYALSSVGLSYNFDFTPKGPKALYCTELGVKCCEAAGIMPPPTTMLNISWKGYLPFCSESYLYPVTLADHFVTTYKTIAITKSCVDNVSFTKNSIVANDLRDILLNTVDFKMLSISDVTSNKSISKE